MMTSTTRSSTRVKPRLDFARTMTRLHWKETDESPSFLHPWQVYTTGERLVNEIGSTTEFCWRESDCYGRAYQRLTGNLPNSSLKTGFPMVEA